MNSGPTLQPDAPVGLTNCDREPIHIPGAIQPHGLFVAIEGPTGRIGHISENVGALCGRPASEWLGEPLSALVADDSADNMLRELEALADGGTPLYLFAARLHGGGVFNAIGHRSGQRLIVEFEPSQSQAEHTAPRLYQLVQGTLARLRKSESLQEMYGICARSVKEISGFDRVMIYRFDHEWNGVVIAEERRPDLEPFLGLHYPASDIPEQARRLYTANWLRFIADRDYVPSPIVPGIDGATGLPIDQSFSVLRSVSPIHLEYLRNMGVGASMSISLVRDGKLWGLIACHHYSPRFVPYDVRTACEMLGQMMSLQLSGKEQQELTAYTARLREVHNKLAARLAATPDWATALVDGDPNLLDFVSAGGAAVVVDREIFRIGQTPGEHDLRVIADFLAAQPNDRGVYATDGLASQLGYGTLSPVAAGLLGITFSSERLVQIMWFRPEQVHTVDWAGDPHKNVVKGGEGVRLSPRGSFSLWRQTVSGRSKPWTQPEINAAGDLRREIGALLLQRAELMAREWQNLQVEAREREEMIESERSARSAAERLSQMKDEFLATLSHELRTPLNAMLGWTELVSRTESMTSEGREGMEIIERNARLQAQMIEDLLDVSRIISGKLRVDVQPVHLPTVVEAAVDTVRPAAEAKGIRIDTVIDPLPGVETTGDPRRLQQIFWNLLSNAVKFTPRGGKVQVTLERVNSHVELSVVDTGQGISPAFLPHVFDRFRQQSGGQNRQHGGLGLGLAIVRNLAELHGGTVQAASGGEGQGSTFVVSLPVRVVRRVSDAERQHPTTPRQFDCEQLPLNDVRVLVVDDEPDARLLIQRLLGECEANATVAGSVQEALALLSEQTFDVLISDIGMPGRDGYALIEELRKLEARTGRPRTPAVALTAYARAEDRRRIMLAGYQVHVAKPVESAELLAVVANLAGRI